MQLPPFLIEEMRRGRVVLCLGAGASVGAKHPDGSQPPLGDALGNLISDRFLDGKYSGHPLAQIAEYAASESSLSSVQSFVKDVFEAFAPTDHHFLLPTFRWRAIFTTNYDLVIERAYQRDRDRVQELKPVLTDQQRIDDVSRSPRDLLLYKLHGCVSRAEDVEIPLILTTDQYVSYRQGRRRLFDRFFDLGHECPVVFIGHGLADHDIRTLFHELESAGEARPRFFLVRPGTDEIQKRFWEQKRVTVLDGSFQDFMETLHKEIPPNIRSVLSEAESGHPIERHFTTHEAQSEACRRFLSDEVDFVFSGMSLTSASPQAFYRGFDVGWAAIHDDYDTRRSITDRVLSEVVLVEEVDRPTTTDLYAVLAEAGAGKTTLLRRIALEAARDWDAVALHLRPSGRINNEVLIELTRLTSKRIFMFVDDAADHVREIESLVEYGRRHRAPITVLTTERKNEWNASCSALEALVQEEYELRYLTHAEIDTLVSKLEEHRSLGHLSALNRQQRIEEFEKRAGRQLLVALHEATEGRPFEDIIEDEYHHIAPMRAQAIYLSICILNRLGGLVRAGVIFRAFGIPFSQFEKDFFEPLERVVQIAYHPPSGDYGYRARHPEIASIVFEKVLRSEDDRFTEVARVLNALNVSFQSDNDAYRHIIRARNVQDMFPNHEAARELYAIASKVAPEDGYRLHQHGIYEMNRPNPSYERAYELLREAENMLPHDRSVRHSLAELQRKRALATTSEVRRAEFRSDARRIATELVASGGTRAYPRHTLIKIAMDELREVAASADSSGSELERAVEQVERQLERGLQESPGDAALLGSEADLREFLSEDERFYEALVAAFEANRRNSYVASRLAKIHQNAGDVARAIEVLSSSLDADRGNRRLHFELAMVLRAQTPLDLDTVLYHLRRSYSPGDHNVEAQFWYGRYKYERNQGEDRRESKAVFQELRNRPLEFATRTNIRDRLGSGDGPLRVHGRLARKDDGIGFVTWAGTGEEVFVHSSNVDPELWRGLSPGEGVSFEIGFDYSGPIALGLRRS